LLIRPRNYFFFLLLFLAAFFAVFFFAAMRGVSMSGVNAGPIPRWIGRQQPSGGLLG
jgi:hypothetical protein